MRITFDSALIAANFEKFKENGSLQESAQLFAQGKPIVEMLQALSMNENVMRAFCAFEQVYPHGNLERGVVEKVILRVSQLHECQFCTSSHGDIMRQLGIDSDLTAAGGHSHRERLAVEYAKRVTLDSNRVSDQLFEELQEHFSNAEIIELTFVVGLITLLNRFNNALGIRYHGEFNEVRVG